MIGALDFFHSFDCEICDYEILSVKNNRQVGIFFISMDLWYQNEMQEVLQIVRDVKLCIDFLYNIKKIEEKIVIRFILAQILILNGYRAVSKKSPLQ